MNMYILKQKAYAPPIRPHNNQLSVRDVKGSKADLIFKTETKTNYGDFNNQRGATTKLQSSNTGVKN